LSRFVVTGGSRGIGYFVAEQLAVLGHQVVIAARDEKRADAAAASIRHHVPGATIDFVALDTASLDSVAHAAGRLSEIDGLALNAGLTSPPARRELTADGLERVMATNYLGHFALVAQTFAQLTPNARIVGMGSMSTRLARAHLANLMQLNGRYSSSKAYAYSKHAVQAFGLELDRRLRARGSGIQSLLAHPGFALDVQSAPRPGINDLPSARARLGQQLLRPMTQGRDAGAAAMVRALTDPQAHGGEFYGPPNGLKGSPRPVAVVPQDRDPEVGAELWRLSEQWAGLTFEL
jgi:NAD(P)-dependent dehydrogenase (short-subunit alcohol dehydrogenase family)